MPSGRMSSGLMPDPICSTSAVRSWSNGAPASRQPSTSLPSRLRSTWSRSALRSNRAGALVLGLLRSPRRRFLCWRSTMRPSPWRYDLGASVVPSPLHTLPRDSSSACSETCQPTSCRPERSAQAFPRLFPRLRRERWWGVASAWAGKSPKISRKRADLRPNWDVLRLLVIGCWWSRWGGAGSRINEVDVLGESR